MLNISRRCNSKLNKTIVYILQKWIELPKIYDVYRATTLQRQSLHMSTNTFTFPMTSDLNDLSLILGGSCITGPLNFIQVGIRQDFCHNRHASHVHQIIVINSQLVIRFLNVILRTRLSPDNDDLPSRARLLMQKHRDNPKSSSRHKSVCRQAVS
ncbi:uncharacterized protein LALA0_S06e04038g [Lachancea lanzarotensis]|uniref:LALA0S06e04038g1_1 n=1 Tax=Lachancea lanzarotensis TaxID=1245769 RepID=A0A0C7MYF3_9SACH|nr:uncharacterized protein LALA0_S06e04038g [Lachancea lanzarotensis]CEP62796.1 LALA0S06e04038g1_1 [Lachancea lanzarotensis]